MGAAEGDRVWIPCPTGEELVQPGYKWKSFREPTASEGGEVKAEIKKEGEVKEENPDQVQAKRSKRSRRAQGQFEMRDKYRVWADTMEEAGVVGWT